MTNVAAPRLLAATAVALSLATVLTGCGGDSLASDCATFKSANEQMREVLTVPGDGDLASTRKQLDEQFAKGSSTLRAAAGQVRSKELKDVLNKAADEMAAHNPPSSLLAGGKICAGHMG